MKPETQAESYDIKSLREKFKRIYGHYPPSNKILQAAKDEHSKAMREANKKLAPYKSKKTDLERFELICFFHGVKL
jgi:hypothetical protein